MLWNVTDKCRMLSKASFVNSVTAFLSYGNAAKKLFFRNVRNEVVDNCDYFSDRKNMNAQKNNSTIWCSRVAEDVSKIRIASDENKRIPFYKAVDFFIRSAWFGIANISNFVAGFFKSVSDRAGAVCINEKFHRLFGRLADKLLFVSQKRSIKYAGLDVFGYNGREFFFDPVKVHPSGQCFKNDIYRCTRTLDARFSMLYVRIYSDMFFKFRFIEHFISSYYEEIISRPCCSVKAVGCLGSRAAVQGRASDTKGAEMKSLFFERTSEASESGRWR